MPQKILLGANIIPYNGDAPKLGANTFVAGGAQIIGNVEIGDESSIWFNTVIRADCHWIKIGERTNVQDGTVIHVTQGTAPTQIGCDVTIGHSAVIHGCTIEDLCLIGMGAIILDGATVPTKSIIAAGSVVPPGKSYPSGWLIMGSPAKPVRQLKEHEITYLKESVKNYIYYQKGY